MYLEGELSLSGSDPMLEELLNRFIDEANRTILTKGISEDRLDEAARVTHWSVDDDTFHLTIESGRLVRATSGLLRIRKALTDLLGKELRIGVRGVSVTDLRALIPLKGVLSDDKIRRVASIPKLISVERRDGSVLISFEPLEEREIQRGIPERALNLIEEILVEEKIEDRTVPPEIPVVRRGETKPIRFDRDPVEIAVDKGWIKAFPGRGQWIYTPPYVKLLEVLEEILIEEVVERLGFQPFMVPKLIPLEVMKMMPGYFDSIPEGMYYVCAPPRDPTAFNRFKDLFRLTNEVSRRELKKTVKAPNYVLDPSQCTPLWYFLSHEILDSSLLPYKFYDRSGWTYRWEGGGVEGLVRVQEFRRVELVYIASPSETIEIRDKVLEESIRVTDEILDMEWRVVAATPFFVSEEEASRIRKEESKDIAAYDLEVYLPHRGLRDSAEWLEITSCFVHKRKFMNSFRIHEVKDREVWSGCSGLGVSRWVAAFLATHGFDSSSWPESVRVRYGKPPQIPKTLEWPKGE